MTSGTARRLRRAPLGVTSAFVAGVLVLVAGCASVPAEPQGSRAATAKPTAAATATTATTSEASTASAPATQTPAATEIRRVLDERWCAGVNSHDLELKMSAYANTVSPFFGKSRATKAEVRTVFGRAFRQYRRMRQRLERVDIKVTGDRAVVRVYKTRVYDGDPGWAEERLTFARTAEGWRIVSEQDIRASD